MAIERRFQVAGVSSLLFFAALLLTAHSARNPGLASTGAVVVHELFRPIYFAVSAITSVISETSSNYLQLIDLRDRYTAQAERLRALEQDKARLIELELENERLRKLVGAAESVQLPVVASRVIGYDPSNWVRSIIIDRGSNGGIESGMAVITPDGVVGQVIATGSSSAKVLLVTDHASGVDALLQNNRTRGVLEGGGSGRLRWRFVLDEEEVQVGDRIITSGMDGVYPPGLFLGRVRDVKKGEGGLFQDIEATPAVDMGKLEEVLVIKRELKKEPKLGNKR